MKKRLITGILLSSLSAEGVVIFQTLERSNVRDSDMDGIIDNIDLNGDGTIDFFTSTRGGEISLVPTNDNRILSVRATLPDLGRAIRVLEPGHLIGATQNVPLTWNGLADSINSSDDGGSVIYRCNGRVPIGEPPTCDSEIIGQALSLVGLELEKDGETHYGWVEISSLVSTFNDLRVHGWAYETEPGAVIVAGAIPEPSSLLLVCLGFPILFRRRR
jgi:hypothetical protein